MLKSKNNMIISNVVYIVIFIALIFMFFFMIPQSDVFLFARDTQTGVKSALNGALYYGNGRLLGNFISMFLSHYFEFAFLLVSTTITLIIAMINNLVFDGNKYTALAVALIVAFPSSTMMSETYFLFASFVNYVLPCLFIVCWMYLAKVYLKNEKKSGLVKCCFQVLSSVLLIISCLFSENTSVLVLCLTVVMSIYQFIMNKKFRIFDLMNSFSAIIGVGIMFVIPKITQTSDKMDHYRGFSISIGNMVASLVKFCEVITNQTLLVIAVSVALILLCWKKSKLSKKIRCFMITYFVLFNVICIILRNFESKNLYLSRINFSALVAVGLYFVLAFVSIVSISEKSCRIKLLMICAAVVSTVAPMMIVTQYGYRTYYATFIMLIIFSLTVVENFFTENEFDICEQVVEGVKKSFVLCSAVIFLLLSSTVCIQAVYNYDFYVIRTDDIRRQVEMIAAGERENYVEAFTLPCKGISIEDVYENIIFDIIDTGRPEKMKTITAYNSESFERIKVLLEADFLYNLKFAFAHLEYKDPLILSQ